jgi:hypothetical protein
MDYESIGLAHARRLPEALPSTIDREGKYYIIMPPTNELFHTPANSLMPISREE